MLAFKDGNTSFKEWMKKPRSTTRNHIVDHIGKQRDDKFNRNYSLRLLRTGLFVSLRVFLFCGVKGNSNKHMSSLPSTGKQS